MQPLLIRSLYTFVRLNISRSSTPRECMQRPSGDFNSSSNSSLSWFKKERTASSRFRPLGSKCFPSCLPDKNEALEIVNSSLKAEKGYAPIHLSYPSLYSSRKRLSFPWILICLLALIAIDRIPTLEGEAFQFSLSLVPPWKEFEIRISGTK